MVSSLVVATLASGAAIGQALNSPPSNIGRVPLDTAETGHVEVDGDEVNLLQSSVNMKDTKKKQPEIGSSDLPVLGPRFVDRLGHDDVGFGSFTSEDYIHCIEGDFHDSETAHSLMRASPISRLYYSHEYVAGATCESRGYSELLQASDDCWEDFTRWIRPGTPMERANYGTPAGGLWADVIDAYDQDRGYAQGTSREWVACGICTDNSLIRAGGAFGQSYVCASALDSEPRVIANMRLAELDGSRIPRGSVLPTSELLCFEGPIENLENYLANARRTPFGALFTDSVVSDQNCEERGFDMPRDLIDECWPETAKVMRTETEDADLFAWVMSYWEVLHYDSSELSDGSWSTIDWVSCNACSPGGAVRARGMWATFHGGDSLPYTDEYCQAAHFPDNMP